MITKIKMKVQSTCPFFYNRYKKSLNNVITNYAIVKFFTPTENCLNTNSTNKSLFLSIVFSYFIPTDFPFLGILPSLVHTLQKLF